MSRRVRELLSDLGLGLAMGGLPWLFYGPAAAYHFWYSTHVLQGLQLIGCGFAATALIAGAFVLLPGRRHQS